MFVCDECGNTYASAWSLKRHVSTAHKDSEDPESEEEEDMVEETDEDETEVPQMVIKLVDESKEFYEDAISNRKKVYEKDGLTADQAKIEVWLHVVVHIV